MTRRLRKMKASILWGIATCGFAVLTYYVPAAIAFTATCFVVMLSTILENRDSSKEQNSPPPEDNGKDQSALSDNDQPPD